ncbi:MAG TPA: tetratricopeptide repeat protein [Candidatus Acidoferrales bacterium]|nr:tetratricopeptide repeat protein [Candidatus Acidoferrales bacterium]
MVGRKLIAAALLTSMASTSIAREHQHGNGEKLGTVHFATSCNEVAQTEFNRAVALLHSFQFSRAIEGFNAVLGEDPTCGIAYWGIALSDWSNPFAPGAKDKSQLQAGEESAERGKIVGAKTAREQAYIAVVGKLYGDYENTPQRTRLLAYRDAMAEVAAKYPEDHEAEIFYALALAASEDPSDKTYADRLEAGAILEKLFQDEPTHPGLAHYIIHTYDVPPLADRALVAARSYSKIAPDAPHALHMPSHTFTRTGNWQESIDSNRAAAAAARREGQTAEELHASDYEIYAYLQTGQDDAAQRIVNSLPEIASRFDPTGVISGAGGPAVGYFALAAIPARYALERQDWKQAAQLTTRTTPFPYAEAMTWFARGLGASRLGQTAETNESATALQEIRERLLKAGENYWAQQVEIQGLAVEAWAALASGKKDEALRRMKSAAEMEDGTEKSAVTPGTLASAHELLGEMLLQMNQPSQALEQFEAALKNEPGRFHAIYGAAQAAHLSGDRNKGEAYYRELLKVCGHADKLGRSELTDAASRTALKPIIENERVAVWDVTDSATARAFDAVVVSLSGNAAFLPKGSLPKIAGRTIVIELKDHPVAPIENTSGYPLAFPRPGAKKILENERVIVWDYIWTPGVTVPMHFHDKDVVTLFFEDGDLKSTAPDGQSVVNSHRPATVKFALRNRTHTETLVRGKQRAIFTELK